MGGEHGILKDIQRLSVPSKRDFADYF